MARWAASQAARWLWPPPSFSSWSAFSKYSLKITDMGSLFNWLSHWPRLVITSGCSLAILGDMGFRPLMSASRSLAMDTPAARSPCAHRSCAFSNVYSSEPANSGRSTSLLQIQKRPACRARRHRFNEDSRKRSLAPVTALPGSDKMAVRHNRWLSTGSIGKKSAWRRASRCCKLSTSRRPSPPFRFLPNLASSASCFSLVSRGYTSAQASKLAVLSIAVRMSLPWPTKKAALSASCRARPCRVPSTQVLKVHSLSMKMGSSHFSRRQRHSCW